MIPIEIKLYSILGSWVAQRWKPPNKIFESGAQPCKVVRIRDFIHTLGFRLIGFWLQPKFDFKSVAFGFVSKADLLAY